MFRSMSLATAAITCFVGVLITSCSGSHAISPQLPPVSTPALSGAASAVTEHASQVRYKLVDIGTFGGASSGTQEELPVINSAGMIAGFADTSTPNHPNSCIFCSSAFITHALRWQNGVVTDLGAIPGLNSSSTNWISANGSTAGFSESSTMDPLLAMRAMHATFWRHGQLVDLGTLEGGFESDAFAVNDRGDVAGVATNTVPDAFNPLGTQTRTFFWQNGVMTDVGTLGGPDAGLVGFKGNVEMNERGDVTACSYTSFTPNPGTGVPTVDPFLWQRGKMIDLGTLGGTEGCSVALNNRGQVVGYSENAGDIAIRPFLWDRGVLKDLGTLGGSWGFANTINDAGDVGGATAIRGDSAHHAFLWRHGVMSDLGTLPGDSCSSVIAMNSRGDVVGQSFPCGGNFRAFLREVGGPMLNLDALIDPSLGITFVDAVGINNEGEIAAEGVLPSGDEHAMVLIPCHVSSNCQNNVGIRGLPFSPRPANSPHARRQNLFAAWRARIARRYHIPALVPLMPGT